MSVYVDEARIPWRGWRMSHMFADSSEELHALAGAIGLKRSWFQDIGHDRDVTTYRRIRQAHVRGEWS